MGYGDDIDLSCIIQWEIIAAVVFSVIFRSWVPLRWCPVICIVTWITVAIIRGARQANAEAEAARRSAEYERERVERRLQEDAERREREAERAKREAERAQRQAREKAERDAKLAQEKAEREARRDAMIRRTDQLVASGDMIRYPGDEMVTCSNGHHYKYSDFRIESRTAETEWVYDSESEYDKYGNYVGYRDESHPVTTTRVDSSVGCPLCKTTVFTFDNERVRKFHEGSCGHWYKGAACHLCKEYPKQ